MEKLLVLQVPSKLKGSRHVHASATEVEGGRFERCVRIFGHEPFPQRFVDGLLEADTPLAHAPTYERLDVGIERNGGTHSIIIASSNVMQ
ncbi:MAG: hypothetical protein U5K81_11725 [Trueperaceae bacterium]|nr:hypothetical protein [Trueperaceae bacterium]